MVEAGTLHRDDIILYLSCYYMIPQITYLFMFLLSCSLSSVLYRLSNRLIDTVAVAPRWDWIIPSSGGCHCEIAFELMSLSVITLCASVSDVLGDQVCMCVTFWCRWASGVSTAVGLVLALFVVCRRSNRCWSSCKSLYSFTVYNLLLLLFSPTLLL